MPRRRAALVLFGLAVAAAPTPGGEEESAGVLGVSEAVPERLAALCRAQCGTSPCAASSAEEWLDAFARSAKTHNGPQQHALAAWAATVWRPRELLPLVLEKLASGDFGAMTGAIFHGTVWRTAWDYVQSEDLDPRELYEFFFTDVFGQQFGVANLTQTPPVRYLQTVLHGFGHAAIFAVHKTRYLRAQAAHPMHASESDVAEAPPANASSPVVPKPGLSCLQHAMETTVDTVLAAERVCATLPTRVLAYVCAGGLYHSSHLAATERARLELTSISSRDRIAERLGNSIAFDVCERVQFKANCVYRAFDLLLGDETIKAEVLAAVAAKNGSGGALDPFCPVHRWGKYLPSCHYGIAGVFGKLKEWTTFGVCDVPLSFDLCRPEAQVFDETTALATAGCVEAMLARAQIASSDKLYKCHQDDEAAACKATCANLLQDNPNPNMRAVLDSCRHSYVCIATSDDNADFMAGLRNVTLLEGGFSTTMSSPLRRK